MTQRTPPKFAAALLRWFGPHYPALAGDLLERYASGESRWWYRRQVVAAILIGGWGDTRTHKVASMLALLGGVICIAVAHLSVPLVSTWLLYRVLQPLAWQQPFVAAHPFVVLWIANVVPFAVTIVIGSCLMGRFSRSLPALKIVFSSAVFVSLLSFWTMQMVWALSRPGRHWPLPYMVAFAGGQVLFPALLAVVTAVRAGHRNRPQLIASRGVSRTMGRT